MLLSHFGEFDSESTANWIFFSLQSLCAVSRHLQRIHSAFAAHLQCIRNESQRICIGVANEQNFFNLFKTFSIRSAVSMESYCSLCGFAVLSPSNRRRLLWNCAAIPRRLPIRLWRMHGDCAANYIRYNGNDVVDCFVINSILRIISDGKVMVK